jgi:hypothetical protein
MIRTNHLPTGPHAECASPASVRPVPRERH